MKTIVLLAAIVALAAAKPADDYSEFDNVNVQEIIDNERLLQSFGKCIINKGPCSPDGNKIKKTIPEAARTTCAKCTPKQRQAIRQMINAYKTKLPDLYDSLVKEVNPDGKYDEQYKKFMEEKD